MHREKSDVICYECKTKYRLKDLQERDCVTYKDENYICWVCDKCNCENFVYKEHGIKSHLVTM